MGEVADQQFALNVDASALYFHATEPVADNDHAPASDPGGALGISFAVRVAPVIAVGVRLGTRVERYAHEDDTNQGQRVETFTRVPGQAALAVMVNYDLFRLAVWVGAQREITHESVEHCFNGHRNCTTMTQTTYPKTTAGFGLNLGIDLWKLGSWQVGPTLEAQASPDFYSVGLGLTLHSR